MSRQSRPMAFWIFVVFIALSIALMLAGQTTCIYNYDLTVRLGLQESIEEVGDFGVQINRAFGVGDTVVYVPLLIVSLSGLLRRKRWALLVTAAVVGVSAYWSITVGSILLFAPGSTGYSYVPGPEIWIFVGAYALFGVWGFFYLMLRGDALLGTPR